MHVSIDYARRRRYCTLALRTDPNVVKEKASLESEPQIKSSLRLCNHRRVVTAMQLQADSEAEQDVKSHSDKGGLALRPPQMQYLMVKAIQTWLSL